MCIYTSILVTIATSVPLSLDNGIWLVGQGGGDADEGWQWHGPGRILGRVPGNAG